MFEAVNSSGVGSIIDVFRTVARPLVDQAQTGNTRISGPVQIWHHPASNRYTTIPNHPGDMPEGTLRAILKQAGIAPEVFLQKK